MERAAAPERERIGAKGSSKPVSQVLISSRKSRLLAEWLLLFAAMVSLLVVGQQRGWLERFDLFLLDLEGQANPAEIDQSLILVEVDELSLGEIGSWPWDRRVQGELIKVLGSYAPRAIAYDVLLIEPTDPASDQALAEAISASENVVLAHSFAQKGNAVDGDVAVLPLPFLQEGAGDIGHVALVSDADGITRSFDLSRKIEGAAFKHFAAATLGVAGESPWQGGAMPQTASVRYGDPDDPAGLQSVPAAAVLSGQVPAEFFEDAIVFVGATAPGLEDRYSVPAYAGGILTGVEMQAHLTSAILTNNVIERASTPFVLAFQIAVIALLFASFWRLSPRLSLIVALALVAGLFGAFFIALTGFNLILPVGAALLAIVIAYPLWGWRRLASVSRFLEKEAANLRELASIPKAEAVDGFDVVAQQVALLKRLTKGVSSNLTLIQDVINASPDAMLVTDGDGGLSLGNFAAQDLFGPMNEVMGYGLLELVEVASGKLSSDRDELTLGDGRTFWLASADLDPDVGSKVLSLREVTEIKEAERQRRETLEFLSHDMRSPQVAIISLANQADPKAGDDGLPMKDRFTRIEDQARRTLKLTEDFVQIARIANEGLEREETEMNSVLQEAADRAFPLAHKKRIKVEFEAGDEPVFARLDAFAVARMLDNLISNAVKFSPEGSQVLLGLEVDPKRSCVVSVADTGPGLSPERREDPFARFGARDTSAGPSSGLGLAYVKQVVDLHEGSIEVKTAPGEGTQFMITLPLGLGG